MIIHELEYREAGEEDQWTRGPSVPQAEADQLVVEGLVPGRRYDIRVRTVNEETGLASPWRLIEGILPTVDPTVPEPPARVRIDGGCLTWDQPEDEQQIVGYIVRTQPLHETHWESAQPVHRGLLPRPPFGLCTIPGGLRTYLVASVDANGRVSTPAAAHFEPTPLDDAETNTILTQDEGTAWTGEQSTALTVNGAGYLEADAYGDPDDAPFWAAGSAPFWVDADTPFWLDDEAPFWGGMFEADRRRFFETDATGFWSPAYRDLLYIAEFSVCSGQGGQDAVVTLDVTTQNRHWEAWYRICGDPFWSGDPDDAFWDTDGTARFWALPGRWRRWPGRLPVATPRDYRFMIWIPGGLTQPVLEQLSFRLSAPTREEITEDLAVPAGGVRVPPTATFRSIRHVGVTVKAPAAGPGRLVVVDDVDPIRGPLVTLLDETQAPATGTVDVRVAGY